MTLADVLIVFIKSPVEGRVKTRLARSIGDKAALRVYERLLERTRSAILPVQVRKEIHLSGMASDIEHFNVPGAIWKEQSGADLGERMAVAFQQAFDNGAQRVVLIGSDLPAISSDLIEQAFQALGKHSAVLGPANDGGYYLIGLDRPMPQLFPKMAWSTTVVFQETLRRLMVSGHSSHLLTVHRDIDELMDLHAAGWHDLLE